MGNDLDERRVTKAIKHALAVIAERDPELGRLLGETIKLGEYLSFSPASQPTPGRKSQGAKKTQRRQGKNPIQPGRK
jgi:hypothetical protein